MLDLSSIQIYISNKTITEERNSVLSSTEPRSQWSVSIRKLFLPVLNPRVHQKMMNSGGKGKRLSGHEKGLSENLLTVTQAHSQQGNKNLFLCIKNSLYMHTVHKHIYGISTVLKYHVGSN